MTIFTPEKDNVRDQAKLEMLRAFPVRGSDNPYACDGNIISACSPTACLTGDVFDELAKDGFVKSHPTSEGRYKLNCYIVAQPQ